MSTFIENLCTRVRKGGPSSRRPGGLRGGLLKRIVVRKQENEKQQEKQTRKNPISRRHGQRQRATQFETP